MKDMKFRVENKEHSRLIQEALFRMGYTWYSGGAAVQWDDMAFLYAEKDGFLMHSDYGGLEDTFFEAQPNEEYVYRLGMVEPRGDRPVQDVPPPVFKMDEVAVTDGISADKLTAGSIQYTRQPLGLRPRHIAEEMYVNTRVQEIEAAVDRYVAAEKDVPWKWQVEYKELLEKIRNYEKKAFDTLGSLA